ncbi:MAG: hypothetical protein NT076_02665 [Candidatus Pacearchaeota archaeon]|nr:hypothetical protein [Candidatus Pacearchaeota archaeon]
MPKQKCWKKRTGKDVWDSDGGTLEVFKSTRTKKYSVAFVPITGKDKFLKSNASKQLAIKKAKKYMKEHDEC